MELCTCMQRCHGGKMVGRTTKWRHEQEAQLLQQAAAEADAEIQPEFEADSEVAGASGEDDDVATGEVDSGASDEDDDVASGEADNDAAGASGEDDEPDSEAGVVGDEDERETTLAIAMPIEELLNESRMPQKKRSKLRKLIFGRQRGSTSTEAREMSCHPTSTDGMLKLYKELGMPLPDRWRVCFGTNDYKHSPRTFPPSPEDTSWRKDDHPATCDCFPRKRKWVCEICAEKCACGVMRKNMLPFDYFPLGKQREGLLAGSGEADEGITPVKSLCYKLMKMSHHKDHWLHGLAQDIRDWWDGVKLQQYKSFFDPESQWELSVQCSCGEYYQAWPERAPELQPEGDHHLLHCTRCKRTSLVLRQFLRGNPCNLALGSHWDSYNAHKGSQHSTGFINVWFLNAGSQEPILLPVLFHPMISSLSKTDAALAFRGFWRPFMEELTSLFLDGIQLDFGGEQQQVRAMLFFHSGDHVAQAKVGQVKSYGKNFN